MKTILTVLLLTILFFSVPLQSYGLEIDFILEARAKTGTTKELVYENETLISQLNWIDHVVPTVGFTGQFGIHNFLLRLGMVFAVPVISGEMENFDYLIAGSTDPSHYSWHDSYLDKDFSLNLEAGYEIKLGRWHITPSVGFQYHNRKWTGSDGYLQYPDIGHWTGNEPKVNLNGPVISYEQAVWFPYFGLEAGFSYFFPHEGKFRLAVHGGIYPYIWAEANDIHYLRNKQFYDSMRGGLGGYFGISVGFFPARANGLGFIFYSGNEVIRNVRGTTSFNNTGISDGPLIITEGHSAGTEIIQWYGSLRIFIPVFRRR